MSEHTASICAELKSFGRHEWRMTDAQGNRIATVEREPDAVLFKAAPDLLEACKAAQKELSFIVHVADRRGGLYEKSLGQIEAAIAKATGASQ